MKLGATSKNTWICSRGRKARSRWSSTPCRKGSSRVVVTISRARLRRGRVRLPYHQDHKPCPQNSAKVPTKSTPSTAKTRTNRAAETTASPPQGTSDTLHQHGQAKRLGDVISCPKFQRRHDLGLGRTGGEHNDPSMPHHVILSQASEYGQAVESGEVHVEEEDLCPERRVRPGEQGGGFLTVLEPAGAVPPGLQGVEE